VGQPDEPPAAAPGFNGRAQADEVLSELAWHPGDVMVMIDDAHELKSAEALDQSCPGRRARSRLIARSGLIGYQRSGRPR
jgi:hypothetical protein